MVLAAEIISILGTVIVAFPCGSALTSSSASRLTTYSIWSLVSWSLGFFLFGVYFNRHPVAGNARHHHVITDIVAFPEMFRGTGYFLAALGWACVLREKFLRNRNKVSPADIIKWVVLPAIFVVSYLIATKAIRGWYSFPSKYLRLMGLLGISGSVIFSVGNFLVFYDGLSIDRDLFVFQTLGFLLYSVNTTLMYTNPDWYAVTAVAIFLFSNVVLLVSLLFTRKTHSYEQLREDAIEMPDLPTSRPRSRVQQEEF